jgi:hypothetical protein
MRHTVSQLSCWGDFDKAVQASTRLLDKCYRPWGIAGTYTWEASGLLVHEELSHHEDAKKTGPPMAMSSVSEASTIGSAR